MEQGAEGRFGPLRRLVSGGQTGADRGALESAQSRGLATGGWVPHGRLTEDGPLDPGFAGMRETDSADPSVRTRRNVRDSDGTLVLSHGPVTGGTALTLAVAAALGRPCRHVDLAAVDETSAADDTARWIRRHRLAVLNVAGPRASEDGAIHAAARRLVDSVLDRLASAGPQSGDPGPPRPTSPTTS